MKLSWQQKELFYHEIAQYTRSGIGLREALEGMLDEMPRGATYSFVTRLLQRTKEGKDLGEILVKERGNFTEVEQALIDAGTTSGRLEECFRYLADYFAALCKSRRAILRGVIYPAFLLHFGAATLNLPILIPSGDVSGYLRAVASVLLVAYILAIGVYLLVSLWLMVATKVPIFDSLLRLFPVIGGIHRFSGLSRFCVTLQMQMQAGIPMLQALPVAGRTSQSANISRAARLAVQRLNEGGELAQSLRQPGTFPAALLRSLKMGQDAGSIDEELGKWGNYYLERMLSRLELLAEWLPRLIYLGIMGYLAFKIISVYMGVQEKLKNLIDF